MKGKDITKRGAEQRGRQRFLGRKGIIVSGHLAAIASWSRDQAAESSTAQTWFLRPVGSRCSRTSHRQRQTAAKSKTFMPWYSKVNESVRPSVAETLRLLLRTHFRSRQSSTGFSRNGPLQYS